MCVNIVYSLGNLTNIKRVENCFDYTHCVELINKLSKFCTIGNFSFLLLVEFRIEVLRWIESIRSIRWRESQLYCSISIFRSIYFGMKEDR